MRAAAEAEDKTDKHPVTPGRLRRRGANYAQCCSTAVRRGSSCRYEAVLKKEPNRLGAYVGAAKSAKASGDEAKAREYATHIAVLTADADGSRPELIEIRQGTTGTKL